MDNALKLCNSLLRSRQSQKHIMLGEILKQRREELGLEVQDIARMTGMPPKQVVALEAGHAAYFAGGKLEVDRLIKLYAKKINMNVDPSFSAHLAADQKPGDKRSAEVMIPAFLMVASPK
jgi:cytoskeletal protein RodZ